MANYFEVCGLVKGSRLGSVLKYPLRLNQRRMRLRNSIVAAATTLTMPLHVSNARPRLGGRTSVERMMPGFRLYMAASIVALALPCSAFATFRARPSHPERQKLSPADRREAVLADLETILTGPATPTSMATRPYLSDSEGLCRRDVIDLAYVPAGGRTDEKAPLKPRSISSITPQYHFLGEEGSRNRADWEKACARLSGDKVHWATSYDDDDRAYDALMTLEIAVAAAQKDKGIKIDCTDLGDERERVNCTSEFIAAAAGINSFGKCEDQPDACYAFSSDRYHFSIRSEWRDNARSTTIKMSIADIIVT
jgi:hypothetical protein